jgi:hypothetical protein
MSNKIFYILKKLIPSSIKTFFLRRILLSLSNMIIQKWSKDTLEPLHQKIIRLEKEIEKLKKTHDK